MSRASTIVILDNGGGTIKLGLSTQQEPKIFPNGIGRSKSEKRPFVGAAMDECRDVASLQLRRPHDRGYLVATDVQREIWQHAFRHVLKIDPAHCTLLVTEPLLNLPSLTASMDELVFQQLGFASYYACPAPLLALHAHVAQHPQLDANVALCGCVVDLGFSFSHAAPIFAGRVLQDAVRRINLGGRALSNYFKELVSFRSINLMEESFLAEHIAKQVMFVSLDVPRDLALSKRRDSPFKLEYILPDGVRDVWGHIKRPAQEGGDAPTAPATAPTATAPGTTEPPSNILQVNNERFVVPEALFSPGDIGLQQAGLAETIVTAIQACDALLHPLLYSNIVLTGGMALLPGLKERLEMELRPLVPIEYTIVVHLPKNPVTAAWEGGVVLAKKSGELAQRVVSRDEYRSRGSGGRRPFVF